MKVEVDGVELTLVKHEGFVRISRVIGRDRKHKRAITARIEVNNDDALTCVAELKKMAAMPTERCTCDYRYGFSDHAEHCQNIYKATEYRGDPDDD